MLNAIARKTLTAGLLILTLYIPGDGKLHKQEVQNVISWTKSENQELGVVLYPTVALTNATFDPTRHTETVTRKDRYHKLAISDRTEQLRNYIQHTYKISPDNVVTIVSAVLRYSAEHNIAPELVFSVISNESSFRNKAKSNVGALGLMQILPVWHQDKIRLDGGSNALLWDTEFNIKIGTQILRDYIHRSRGNVYEALARYNGSLGKNNGYPEKVLRKKERYKGYIKAIK